jgi:hypothetical protein
MPIAAVAGAMVAGGVITAGAALGVLRLRRLGIPRGPG